MSYNRWLSRTNELYHHGVKGQKWGVRRQRGGGKYIRGMKRDLTLLNERRYNVSKKDLKSKYKYGQIDAYDYNVGLDKAKSKYKSERNKIKGLKQTKSKEETRKDFERIRKQALKEVPNYKLKSGIKTANKIISGIAVGSLVVSAGAYAAGAAFMGSAYGAATATAYAAGGATNLGISGAYTYGYHKIRNAVASSFT